MGTGEMPLLVPVTRSVSASISRRTSSKSVNFFPLQCRNSAYSAPEAGGRATEHHSPTCHQEENPIPNTACSSLPITTPPARYALLSPPPRWGTEAQRGGAPPTVTRQASFSGYAGLLGAGVGAGEASLAEEGTYLWWH